MPYWQYCHDNTIAPIGPAARAVRATKASLHWQITSHTYALQRPLCTVLGFILPSWLVCMKLFVDSM